MGQKAKTHSFPAQNKQKLKAKNILNLWLPSSSTINPRPRSPPASDPPQPPLPSPAPLSAGLCREPLISLKKYSAVCFQSALGAIDTAADFDTWNQSFKISLLKMCRTGMGEDSFYGFTLYWQGKGFWMIFALSHAFLCPRRTQNSVPHTIHMYPTSHKASKFSRLSHKAREDERGSHQCL